MRLFKIGIENVKLAFRKKYQKLYDNNYIYTDGKTSVYKSND